MLEVKEVTFFEKLAMAQKLWQYIPPSVPFPPRKTVIHWFAVYAERSRVVRKGGTR